LAPAVGLGLDWRLRCGRHTVAVAALGLALVEADWALASSWLAASRRWVAATAAGRVTQITLHLPQNELNTHSPDQKQEACQRWDKQ
jgi:hypothetical protein